MSTWGLASTTPLQDFEADPEDLIYKYLGTNWSITSPTHINKLSLFQTTTPADMINRPTASNKPVWLWVQHFSLDSGRDLFGSTIGTHGFIQHNHAFQIHLFTTRLSMGLTFPDLGQLIREVERLIYQYQEGQITQIQQFVHFRVFPVVESTDFGEAWAGTYRVTCEATAQYQKLSIL
jgi:hypothetical protein